jgi:hypothetical protein
VKSKSAASRKEKLETCRDCPVFPCAILSRFWSKNGWKYQQYRKQLEFIKQNGNGAFLKRADTWKGPRGKTESSMRGRSSHKEKKEAELCF